MEIGAHCHGKFTALSTRISFGGGQTVSDPSFGEESIY
jgi:hypothetical protein